MPTLDFRGSWGRSGTQDSHEGGRVQEAVASGCAVTFVITNNIY